MWCQVRHNIPNSIHGVHPIRFYETEGGRQADNDGIVTPTGPDAPVIAGWVVLVDDAATAKDDTITGNKGMGGQGVLPVSNVYNGWVQKLPTEFKSQLTAAQQNPVP